MDWGGTDWNEELQEDSFTIFLSPSKLLEALSQAMSCQSPECVDEELGWICTEAGETIGCDFEFLLRINTTSSSWKEIPQPNPFCVVPTAFD